MVIKVQITFAEILKAQNLGFENHRELVALKFRDQGFIVIDFMALKYRTYQDGHKRMLKIKTIVEGEVGKALMKAP